MKVFPLIVSIVSHIFFNPLLFYIVRGSLSIRAMETATEDPGFRAMAPSYITRSVLVYGVVMSAIFGVLALFGLTRGIAGFLDTQFLYHSYWRAPIIAVTAVNIYLWAAGAKVGGAAGLVLSSVLLTCLQVCMIIQIVLFFKHLY
jgi:hypothetical protein